MVWFTVQTVCLAYCRNALLHTGDDDDGDDDEPMSILCQLGLCLVPAYRERMQI